MPELVFKGKEYVYNHHLTIPYRPLIADPAKSLGAADLAGNLIIHGDNLHALKALLPRYAGKVDLVFIDPPYNTGNENWSYNDNVNSPIMKEWLRSNPVNAEDMLRHDKWLCMMWPRLVLLRELLSERGSLWMTLDDNEIHHARAVLDEIFGEAQFVATMVWQKRYSRENRESIGDAHDYVVVYATNPDTFKRARNLVEPTDKQLEIYRNPNNDPRGRWRAVPMTAQGFRQNQMYAITTPTGVVHHPPEGRCWSMVESEYRKLLEAGRIWFGVDGNAQPNVIRYEDEIEGFVPWTWWPNYEAGHTDEAKKELYEMLGRGMTFGTPKPLRLLSRIIQIATDRDSIVLDSFAGSATTAHAVLAANSKDGGNRQFLMVESEDYAETVTAERVRRAIGGYAFEGKQREDLLREKLTWAKLRKADELNEKVVAIRSREGFGDANDLGNAPSSERRFDRINVKVEDGQLVVEGERRASERVEALGGEFTFCTLGDPIDPEGILSGRVLPDYENLGAWLFYSATGATLDKSKVRPDDGYLGEAQNRHVWLIYKPDLGFLKSADAALTLSFARRLRDRHADKSHLVFAPAKFLSNKQLLEYGVEYAPLPFALYREG